MNSTSIIHLAVELIYVAPIQDNYSEMFPAEASSKRGDYSKRRDPHRGQLVTLDPQSRKPFRVWWQHEHVVPQSHSWKPNEEIGDPNRPK